MTPEQEERLSMMMQRDIRNAKRIKRPSPEDNPSDEAIQDKIDTSVGELIVQYLKQAGEPVLRLQIIKDVDFPSNTIDRSLRRLAKSGKARRIQTSYATHWEVVDWLTAPSPD